MTTHTDAPAFLPDDADDAAHNAVAGMAPAVPALCECNEWQACRACAPELWA